MPYSILASVCQHPIRTSSSLPWSGSNLDFSVRYCPSCEASRSIRQDYDRTESRYRRDRDIQELFPEETRASTYRSHYRDNRREYDRSRLAYREDQEYQQDRQDRERRDAGRETLREESRRFAGLDDPEWVAFRDQMNGSSRTTRFAEPQSYRRESQYREQRDYRRRSSHYEPGRYASGYDYYNTSDPSRDYVVREPSSRRRY